MARFYSKGSEYGVSFFEREIDAFIRRWPASGLHGLRNVFAVFDRRNGDLIDLECNRRSCARFDGEALKALVDDMQTAAKKHFGLSGFGDIAAFGAIARMR